MYLGANDLPPILQGAAQRENLGPQMLPEITTTVSGGWLTTLALGIAAAWLLAGNTARRTLWILAALIVSGAASLSAQLPAGMTAWVNMGEWCNGTFSATYTSFEPSKSLLALQRAKACRIGLVIVYPRRLYTTNGQNKGPYSKAKHRALSDAYAKALPPDTLRKYVVSRTLLGIVTGDDFGCAPCWGGVVIPRSEARDGANYAKQKMPAAPIGIRLDALKASDVLGWKSDFMWAQWVASKYNLRVYKTQSNWYGLNAKAAKSLGVHQFYGFNTHDCYGAPANDPNRKECPPSTVKQEGTVALAVPENCGMIAWRYEPSTWNGAYKVEWVKLLNTAKTKPYTSCKVR